MDIKFRRYKSYPSTTILNNIKQGEIIFVGDGTDHRALYLSEADKTLTKITEYADEADKLDGKHAKEFHYIDGSNPTLSISGKDKNGENLSNHYRCILEQAIGNWFVGNIVIAVTSRHSGTGIYAIDFQTGANAVLRYGTVRFYGSNTDVLPSVMPVQAYYNPTTKKVTIWVHHRDYNDIRIHTLSRKGFNDFETQDPIAANNDNTIPVDNLGTAFKLYYNRSDTSDKLTTERTISLSDDITGSVGFDGSKDVTIKTTSTYWGKDDTNKALYPKEDNHKGIYSNTFISVKGSDNAADLNTNNSFDVDKMWEELKNNDSTKTINTSHINNATTSTNGLMNATDKALLDSIPSTISNETTRAKAAEKTNADAIAVNKKAINDEVTNRNNAISSAISTEVTNRNTAISTEIGKLDSSTTASSGKALAGVTITNGKISSKTEVNIPTTLPASDVYAWAKAETKPTYTASEVGALPSNGKAVDSAKLGGELPGAYQLVANMPTSLPANGGNSDTATKLATSRTIWGQSFDGTADITSKDLKLGSAITENVAIRDANGNWIIGKAGGSSNGLVSIGSTGLPQPVALRNNKGSINLDSNGNTVVSGVLTANTNVATKKITLTSPDGAKTATITLDNDGYIHFNAPIYSSGSITAMESNDN